jgi:predicted deacetylase
VLFNLSLDDFSPHPKAGLNFESIYWCFRLIELYPNIKINLFVPAKYARLNENPYPLTDNPEWCAKVNDLPPLNFQIGLHGLFHRSSVNDFVFHTHESNNDEFRYLNERQSAILVANMINEFEQAGLKYAKVFRPPRWSISSKSAQELTNRGFVIAGHDDYRKQCRDIVGVRWVSVNWHLDTNPPEKNVIAAAHTSDWTYNYFNEERFRVVKGLLESRKYSFRFLGDF